MQRSQSSNIRPPLGWGLDFLPNYINAAQTSQALFNMAANLFGAVIILLLYYNYLLLQPYWSPIVASVLFSIALHSAKVSVAQDIRFIVKAPDSFYFTFVKMTYERFLHYMRSLLNESKRLFKSSRSSLQRSDSSDFTTPVKKPGKGKSRNFVTMPPKSPTPISPSSALYSTPSEASPEPGGDLATRRRPGTFPFLFVMLGIGVLVAAHLPIFFYVITLIVAETFLLLHLFIRVTGLSPRFCRFIQRKADAIASALVIIALVTVIIGMSAFFSFNCAVEVTRAATDLYGFINTQIDNQEVRDYIQSLGLQDEVHQAMDAVYTWTNKTFSPGLVRYVKTFNMSAADSFEEGATRRIASQLLQSGANFSMVDFENLMTTFGFPNFTIFDLGHPMMKATEVVNAVGNVGISVVRLLLVSCFMVVSQLFSIGLQVIVFFTLLIYLLNAKHNAIHYFVQLFPVEPAQRNYIRDRLNAAIRDTLECSLQVLVTHAFLTYVTFRFVGVEYVYSATLLSGLMSVIPLIGSWLISVPGGLLLWYRGSYLSSIGLVAFHLLTYLAVDPWIYNVVSNMHPFITSLSIVMGYYAFDVPGVFFGPVLVLGALITREIFTEVYHTSNRAHNGHDPSYTSDYDS